MALRPNKGAAGYDGNIMGYQRDAMYTRVAPASRHKSSRACQAQSPADAANAQQTQHALNQEQAYAGRLVNHDMQHFNIRFAHALAGKAGNTANGLFHIALYNTLASRKNLALHGQIVRSDGGIHCR